MKQGKMLTLRRGLQLMTHCAQQRHPIPFNRLKRLCDDISPATLNRLLVALVDEGIVAKTDAGYGTGERFVRLARMVLGSQSKRELLQPLLFSLAEDTQESAAFFELNGERMVLLAKCEQHESFHYMDLMRTWGPLRDDTFGLVCLANLLDRKNTSETLRKTLHQVRETLAAKGAYTDERELRARIVRVVAPVWEGDGGSLTGSLGITAYAGEFARTRLDDYLRHVAQTARYATELLTT